MSELDKVLINLFRKQSSDVSDKNVIRANGKHGIKKIAFDMFKVVGDTYDDLWRMENVNGEDFLVRCSDRSGSEEYEEEETPSWSAISNHGSDNVTLKYKNVPICTFSSEEYGFGTDDVLTFKSALLDVIKEDGGFIGKIVASQPKSKAEALKNVFPEIKQIIK
jgi:hypothetical protein